MTNSPLDEEAVVGLDSPIQPNNYVGIKVAAEKIGNTSFENVWYSYTSNKNNRKIIKNHSSNNSDLDQKSENSNSICNSNSNNNSNRSNSNSSFNSNGYGNGK